ncbi:hypothetical protein N0B44_23065 [Roseibacterium beibuensis]|uniref:Uncharacterized protein n=1 Tax=[Roseibacterium] beibuensis TaxID=1193142 RepID=A0ABP9LM86_9RHOB|nr:hypothetical protein [Roseibacterium beibuensis]MCS6625799.1 hypothetical protein [Roseibacterium beibuensis]
MLVEGAGEDTGRICAIVAATQRQFDRCGSLTIPEDIEIAINPDLGLNCVGLCHCGKHRTELLPPDTYNDDTTMSATGELSTITPGAGPLCAQSLAAFPRPPRSLRLPGPGRARRGVARLRAFLSPETRKSRGHPRGFLF